MNCKLCEISPNVKELAIINDVMNEIKLKYGKGPISLKEFEIFEPLSPKWKTNFIHLGGCVWGSNGSNVHFENPIRLGGHIWLTRCDDEKAFYELVFHEIYEYLVGGGHEKIIPEEKRYIEKKFCLSLSDWKPLEDEIIRTLYAKDKMLLENAFNNCGEFSRTWQQIEQRAKELGLVNPS
jgi:hypothetical protein